MYFGCAPLISGPGCEVLVALDRHGHQRVEWLNTGTVTGAQLRVLFSDALEPNATLLCDSGRFGPFGQLRFTAEGRVRCLIRVPAAAGGALEPYHNRNARGWLARYRRWVVRFHGIATKYVPNYLAWRTKLDRIESGPWLEAMMPYLMGPTSPTIPDDTGGRAAGGGSLSPGQTPPATLPVPVPLPILRPDPRGQPG